MVRTSATATLLLVLLSFAGASRAARRDDPRARVTYVAESLAAGNATQAMSIFDKGFRDYETLSTYFQALTSAFQIESEIEVLDEQDAATNATLAVNWRLTLTDLGTGSTRQRNDNVTIRLELKAGKWKIVDFSPVALFNPAQKRTPGP